MRTAKGMVGKIKWKDCFIDIRIILQQFLLDKQGTTVVNAFNWLRYGLTSIIRWTQCWILDFNHQTINFPQQTSHNGVINKEVWHPYFILQQLKNTINTWKSEMLTQFCLCPVSQRNIQLCILFTNWCTREVFKNNIKIYIKTAPTCFGLITITKEHKFKLAKVTVVKIIN